MNITECYDFQSDAAGVSEWGLFCELIVNLTLSHSTQSINRVQSKIIENSKTIRATSPKSTWLCKFM